MSNLGYWSGFVPDAQMSPAVPSSEWLQALGPRLSTVFVDTCRLFHRAMPPSHVDRYSMTFSFASTTPHQVFPEFMANRETMRQIRDQLTPRQRRAALMDD